MCSILTGIANCILIPLIYFQVTNLWFATNQPNKICLLSQKKKKKKGCCWLEFSQEISLFRVLEHEFKEYWRSKWCIQVHVYLGTYRAVKCLKASLDLCDASGWISVALYSCLTISDYQCWSMSFFMFLKRILISLFYQFNIQIYKSQIGLQVNVIFHTRFNKVNKV